MKTSLAVIVPVFNEQYLVAASLERLRVLEESPLLERIRIIVVDDGSWDQTPQVLARWQHELAAHPWPSCFEWIFLHHEKNLGKGASLQTALAHVDTELVVVHDADLEYFPRDLLRMVQVLIEQNADAVFGSRFLSGEFKRVLFFRHALANHFLTFLCNLVCDWNLTDMETCYKLVRSSLLRSIPLVSRDFRIEPEITIKLAKRRARIFEVPISYAGRSYQEGKKINWRDGIRALLAIARFAISDRIYTDEPALGETLERLARAPRFSRWMADTIRPFIGQRVLEIGAGTGNLTVHLAPRSLYWASDINPLYLAVLERLRETRPYLQVSATDGTKRESFPQQTRFDTVICLNVLEHLDQDLEALKNIHAALEPGGRAVVLTPHGRRLYGTLDVVLGHRRRYSAQDLRRLGEQAGFVLEALLPFNRLGSLAWWINGRLLRRKRFGLAQIKLLNLLVPLLRWIDRWLPLPPLSLIAIFRKPSAAAQPVPTTVAVAATHRP